MDFQFSLEWKELPLRYAWRLSRNTSLAKTNGIVRLSWAGMQGMGEVAPNIRYGETVESVEAAFRAFCSRMPQPGDWTRFAEQSNLPSCLLAGLDMAFQDARIRREGTGNSPFRGLPPVSPRPMAYTIPVMGGEELRDFFLRENLSRFSWLKLKVNRELASEALAALLSVYSGPVAIDGNEAWTDAGELLQFCRGLPPGRILFLEQPMPDSLRHLFPGVKAGSPVPVWGDESVLQQPDPLFWMESFSGINVKLMKAGTLERARTLLETARNAGLGTMIGCMVETSLGISAALRLESLADYLDLDGFLLLESEPFGLLREEGGILRPATV